MRVLVAEDDPLIALGLAERLRSLGHEPIGPACDGAQAVELAKANLPDLYLFDIEMPNVDGLEAATQLAGDGLRRPVVVVTGVDDPSLIERSIASGVSAYLTKPVDSRELRCRASSSPPRGTPSSRRSRPKSIVRSRRSRTASSSSARRGC